MTFHIIIQGQEIADRARDRAMMSVNVALREYTFRNGLEGSDHVACDYAWFHLVKHQLILIVKPSFGNTGCRWQSTFSCPMIFRALPVHL